MRYRANSLSIKNGNQTAKFPGRGLTFLNGSDILKSTEPATPMNAVLAFMRNPAGLFLERSMKDASIPETDINGIPASSNIHRCRNECTFGG